MLDVDSGTISVKQVDLLLILQDVGDLVEDSEGDVIIGANRVMTVDGVRQKFKVTKVGVLDFKRDLLE